MSTARTARRKKGNRTATRSISGGQLSGLNQPAREEIERRAYDIYLARGGADGHDQEDWLQAENELKEAES